MNSEKLKRVVVEDRRLVFLKIMAAQIDYSSNVFVIRDALAALGHHAPLDRIVSDAAWLEEQGLITSAQPAPNLAVYKLTARGRDVAVGAAVVPGVKQPEPGLDY